jgi:hypothetical protein
VAARVDQKVVRSACGADKGCRRVDNRAGDRRAAPVNQHRDPTIS